MHAPPFDCVVAVIMFSGRGCDYGISRWNFYHNTVSTILLYHMIFH